MGMDVYGKAPATKAGEYFRANVWSWHPIWDYCCEVEPSLCEKVTHAHSNDGDGLDAADSRLLAASLQHELQIGATAEWLGVRQSHLDAIPDEPCEFCATTGIRHWPDGDKPCNGCEGKGHKRPFKTWYGFDQGHLERFVEFLDNCGGFEIN
jgi:hypothetical protein